MELIFDMESTLLKTIFLRSVESKSEKHRDLIPLGLSFDITKEMVRSMLGEPDREGKPGARTALGDVPLWDLYNKENYSINIQYRNNVECSDVELITIMYCK